jgi:hypothetical protein
VLSGKSYSEHYAVPDNLTQHGAVFLSAERTSLVGLPLFQQLKGRSARRGADALVPIRLVSAGQNDMMQPSPAGAAAYGHDFRRHRFVSERLDVLNGLPRAAIVPTAGPRGAPTMYSRQRETIDHDGDGGSTT